MAPKWVFKTDIMEYSVKKRRKPARKLRTYMTFLEISVTQLQKSK